MVRLFLASFQAIPQRLSSSMQQQLDRPFAAMQLPADLGQFAFATILQVDRFSSTRPQSIHADWQVPHDVVVIRPLGVRRHHGLQFQAKFCPRRFFAAFQTLDVFAQQVTGNSQQPRSDQGAGIEASLRKVKPQKDFLRHIVSVSRLKQPGAKVSVDGALMSFDDGCKRRSIATSKLLDECLVGGQQQNCGPKKAGREKRAGCRAVVKMVRSFANQKQPR